MEMKQVKMLSVNEVAEQLSVSHMTVRRLIDAGSLRASRIGGQLRIRPEDLELCINQNVVKPWPPTQVEKAKPKRRPGRQPKSGTPTGGYYPGMKVV